MIVCYFGTYRKEYSRNKIMMAALRSAGVEVKVCHVPLWYGIEDRVNAVSGGWKKPAFIFRVIKVYINLLWKFFRNFRNFDVMVVGYPGVTDIFIAKLICFLKRKKLVWDVLMSIYQVSIERNLIKENQKTSNHLLRRLERHAANLADLLIMDTKEHVNFFSDLHHLQKDKFGVVRLGADESIFYIREKKFTPNTFTVLYYGGFLRNHGVPFIIEAARLLKDENINFQMIGSGPELNNAKQLSEKYNLHNITYLGYLDIELLIQKIVESDVCLGIFGISIQAEVSVNNKIYECMAMGKAIITGDTLSIKEMSAHGALLTCSRENPAELAHAILKIKADPALKKLYESNARTFFESECSTQKLGINFLKSINNILENTN
jgi:glycosyltransferase involved in cell wall biosynthesis